jgi:hypothetical protein
MIVVQLGGREETIVPTTIAVATLAATTAPKLGPSL